MPEEMSPTEALLIERIALDTACKSVFTEQAVFNSWSLSISFCIPVTAAEESWDIRRFNVSKSAIVLVLPCLSHCLECFYHLVSFLLYNFLGFLFLRLEQFYGLVKIMVGALTE